MKTREKKGSQKRVSFGRIADILEIDRDDPNDAAETIDKVLHRIREQKETLDEVEGKNREYERIIRDLTTDLENERSRVAAGEAEAFASKRSSEGGSNIGTEYERFQAAARDKQAKYESEISALKNTLRQMEQEAENLARKNQVQREQDHRDSGVSQDISLPVNDKGDPLDGERFASVLFNLLRQASDSTTEAEIPAPVSVIGGKDLVQGTDDEIRKSVNKTVNDIRIQMKTLLTKITIFEARRNRTKDQWNNNISVSYQNLVHKVDELQMVLDGQTLPSPIRPEDAPLRDVKDALGHLQDAKQYLVTLELKRKQAIQAEIEGTGRPREVMPVDVKRIKKAYILTRHQLIETRRRVKELEQYGVTQTGREEITQVDDDPPLMEMNANQIKDAYVKTKSQLTEARKKLERLELACAESKAENHRLSREMREAGLLIGTKDEDVHKIHNADQELIKAVQNFAINNRYSLALLPTGHFRIGGKRLSLNLRDGAIFANKDNSWIELEKILVK